MNIAAQRLANQRLVGEPFKKPEDTVSWLGAVQSQDFAGAKWAVGQRTRAATDLSLNQAFNAGRILRTHVLRPTWHFVAPEDIRWILRVSAPRVHGINAYYYRMCELDAPLLARTQELMVDALRGGNYLTRDELAKMLEAEGIVAKALRLSCIVMHAELEAAICSGPLRGKQFTYAVLDERAPSPGNEGGVAELLLRYLRSHGPATLHDFAYWASLTMCQAKEAMEQIEQDLQSEAWRGKTYYWDLNTKPRRAIPSMRLLPNYDEHVGSYKDGSPLFEPDLEERMQTDEAALQAHILVSSGKVIGGWRRTVVKKSVEIELRLLRPLDEDERSLLDAEVERFSRFFGYESWRILGG